MRTNRSVFVGVSLVAVIIGLTSCGGPEERKAEYRAKAQQYFAEGNFPKARVALKNVLKIDPNDSEGYFLYAQVEEKEKNWQSAFQKYLRVVDLSPGHREALLKLGQLYLQAREFEKVNEVVEKVVMTHPEDLEAQSLGLAVKAAQGDVPQAISELESIIQQHPTHPDIAILLSALYSISERFEKALHVLRPAAEADPSNIKLLASMSSLYSRLKDWPNAGRVLRQIVDIEPTVSSHHVRLAAFYQERQEHEKARAILRQAIALEPEDENRRLALAELLVTQKAFENAEMTLIEAQKTLPYATRISFGLASFYDVQKRRDDSRRVYQQVIEETESASAKLKAQVRLATFDVEEGLRESAQTRLAEVLEENPRFSEGLLLKGKLALLEKNSRDAIQAFRTVLRDQPKSSSVQTLLGRAYLLGGEVSLARESFELAVKYNPRGLDARRLLANLNAQEGNIGQAEVELKEILKGDSQDLQTLGMLFGLQMVSRQWDEVDATVQRMSEAGADQFSTALAKANVSFAQEQWEDAEHWFKLAGQVRPEDPRPLIGMVQVQIKQGTLPRAHQYLQRVLSNAPNHPYAHGLLGEVLMLQGDVPAAEQEFILAQQIKSDWALPWLRHATLKIGNQELGKAIPILQNGVKVNPGSKELRILLASSFSQVGKVDSSIEEYEALLQQNPKALVVANNLATILTDKKGDPSSLKRALELSRPFESMKEQPFLLDTLGWVYAKLGRNEDAIRLIREAVAQAPNHPLLNYHLGFAYHQSGQAKEARVYLSKAVNSGETFTGVEEAKSILVDLKG